MEKIQSVVKTVDDFVQSFMPKIDHFESVFTHPFYMHFWPWFFGILYLLMLYFFPKIQSKYRFLHKRPKTMKLLFFFWNMFLTVFSAINVSYGTLEFVFLIFNKYEGNIFERFFMTVCSPDCAYHVPTRGTQLMGSFFAYSKFFELVDTFLLILKKPERELSFLHCYHHFTVLIATWYGHSRRFSAGFWFAYMNSWVHMFMYYYFAVATYGYRPAWSIVLTFAQTFQMVLGLTFTGTWVWGKFVRGYDCCCDNIGPIFAMFSIIYSSYLFLFTKFLIKKYFLKPKKTSKKSDKKGKKKNKKEK